MNRRAFQVLIPIYIILCILVWVLFFAMIPGIEADNSAFPFMFFVFWMVWMFLVLTGYVFNVFMMVDCALRPFKSRGEKIAWIIVIFVVSILGAIIYYYVIGKEPAKKPDNSPLKNSKNL